MQELTLKERLRSSFSVHKRKNDSRYPQQMWCLRPVLPGVWYPIFPLWNSSLHPTPCLTRRRDTVERQHIVQRHDALHASAGPGKKFAGPRASNWRTSARPSRPLILVFSRLR
jgi:hypothetical protein